MFKPQSEQNAAVFRLQTVQNVSCPSCCIEKRFYGENTESIIQPFDSTGKTGADTRPEWERICTCWTCDW